jgi:hypothetical protein
MPTVKKRRISIPPEVSARVLFLSDRTCCVCRTENNKVQIHHIDDDPSNNSFANLAVLCLECHDLTQVKGGFGRRLDSDQVTLYRDDWIEMVKKKRASDPSGGAIQSESLKLERATSIAEIYKEQGRFVELALHYNSLGQNELRDKYIGVALKRHPSDQDIVLLRGKQGRPDLIPEKVVKRRLKFLKGYPVDIGYLYLALERYPDVAREWIADIQEILKKGNYFSAAFYMKRLVTQGVVEQLFVLALKKARKRNDLWWQLRALEELGWTEELRKLLLSKAKSINKSKNLQLKRMLASARGDSRRVIDLDKQIARLSFDKVHGIER